MEPDEQERPRQRVRLVKRPEDALTWLIGGCFSTICLVTAFGQGLLPISVTLAFRAAAMLGVMGLLGLSVWKALTTRTFESVEDIFVGLLGFCALLIVGKW